VFRTLDSIDALQEQELQKRSDLMQKERYVELLRQKKALIGKRDLWFFNKYILGYNDLTDKNRFHGELCRYVEDTRRRFVLALMPRGSLKTSIAPIGFSLQTMINDPNVRILLASEEFNLAQKILSEIKGHVVGNQEFRRLYGNLEGKVKWNEKEIVIPTRTFQRKEPTLTCAGIDVTKVGNHYDLIFVDDPHSDKNVGTREQIEKVKQWYKLLLSLLDPPKARPKHLPPPRIIITATRWHYDDLSGWITERERERQETGRKPRYHILTRDAILKGDLNGGTKKKNLLWPERLSKDYLMDQRADQGPYIFNCQYRNRPIDDDSALFKRSWVQFYNPVEDIRAKELTFATLDPIRDEESSDFASIVVCSMGRDWIAKIREVRRGKWDDYETLENMISVWKKWHVIKFGVESVAWQKVYYRFLKAESVRRGIHLPIMELKTDTRTTKKMRIRSMVPYWRAGFFKVPGTSIATLQGNLAILVDELLRYPRVTNDDCVDALAYMDQLLQRPSVSAMIRKAPRNSFQGIRESEHKAPKRLGKYNVRQVA
jgi:hypothetical protein